MDSYNVNKMSILTNVAIKLAIYYVTAPNMEVAKKLSQILVTSRLIACCNIIDNVQSIYIWENKMQSDKEVLMVMKSRELLAHQIAQIVKTHHPYEVPEVIAIPIIAGSSKYMNWVIENTKDPTSHQELDKQYKLNKQQKQP